jgi:hypothetical protein
VRDGGGLIVAEAVLVRSLLSWVDPEEEWTTLSVGDLVEENVRRRRPLFAALDRIFREAHGHVLELKTSEAMATFGCRTSAERRKRLRRLYKVGGPGPWVSHVRVHREARRLLDKPGEELGWNRRT